jgi:excisionase family DNA binding protein
MMHQCPLMQVKHEEYPPILTVAQASRMLQLDRHTIYELVRQRRIPAFKAGRAIRIHRDRLLEMVARGEV